MKTIEESRLESDLAYRFEYLAEFIGFTASDTELIQAAGPYPGPMIPEIVERTYTKLLAFDATARYFVPHQAGFEGPVPAGGLDAITAVNPQVQFRKEHLSRYFMQILGRTCDAKMVIYQDMVGRIRTPKAGNAQIDIPLVQMNALMGYFSDILFEVISSSPMDSRDITPTIRAFNKRLWIQNDFITRHYKSS